MIEPVESSAVEVSAAAVRAPAGAASLEVALWGVTLSVDAPDPAVLAALTRHLPFGALPVSGGTTRDLRYRAITATSPNGPVHELYAGAERVARRRRLDRLALAFGAHARLFVAEHAVGWVFLHAGVVAINGRAVLLPGRSGAGKTTLVTELVRRGAVYYSDEYAVVDDDGLVHPFAKPLSVRRVAGARRLVDVTAIGGVVGSGPLPVGAVVATSHHPGALWRPEAMTAGEMALCLLDNAPAARSRFRDVRERIARLLAHGAVGWRSPRGGTAELARWLGYTEPE